MAVATPVETVGSTGGVDDFRGLMMSIAGCVLRRGRGRIRMDEPRIMTGTANATRIDSPG